MMDHFDLTTRDMGLEFKYGFGKVLGTQNRLTLGLAFSHCILCLNLNKGLFHTCLHTHSLGSIVPLPQLLMSGKMEGSIRA